MHARGAFSPHSRGLQYRFAEPYAYVSGFVAHSRDDIHHVPTNVICILVEPYVDQFGDPFPASVCAVKDVMIDTVLAEQLREALAVMLLNRIAKVSQHVLYVHLGLLHPVEVASVSV